MRGLTSLYFAVIVDARFSIAAHSQLILTLVDSSKKKGSLLWAMCKTFGPTFLVSSFLKLLQDLLAFVSPQLLRWGDSPDWYYDQRKISRELCNGSLCSATRLQSSIVQLHTCVASNVRIPGSVGTLSCSPRAKAEVCLHSGPHESQWTISSKRWHARFARIMWKAAFVRTVRDSAHLRCCAETQRSLWRNLLPALYWSTQSNPGFCPIELFLLHISSWVLISTRKCFSCSQMHQQKKLLVVGMDSLLFQIIRQNVWTVLMQFCFHCGTWYHIVTHSTILIHIMPWHSALAGNRMPRWFTTTTVWNACRQPASMPETQPAAKGLRRSVYVLVNASFKCFTVQTSLFPSKSFLGTSPLLNVIASVTSIPKSVSSNPGHNADFSCSDVTV